MDRLCIMEPDSHVEIARSIYKSRLDRLSFLDEDLLGEPAWNILLYLFIVNGTGKTTYISELCSAANAPQSVAARWISILEKRGLIVNWTDEEGLKELKISLSNKGVNQLTEYFRHIDAGKTQKYG